MKTGKYYVDRGGDIIGPLEFDSDSDGFHWSDPQGNQYYDSKGQTNSDGSNSSYDLMKEIDILPTVNLEPNKTYKTREGFLISFKDLKPSVDNFDQDYVVAEMGETYTKDGYYFDKDHLNLFDLVEEYKQPTLDFLDEPAKLDENHFNNIATLSLLVT